MRKILTLTAAILASFSLWAADPTLPADAIPTETLDVVSGDANVATKANPFNTDSLKQFLVYDLGTEIRTNALKGGKAKWVAGPKNDGGSSVSSITFATSVTDADKYLFSTSSLNKWGIHSGRYCGFRVINCSSAAVSTKSNGTNNGKTLQLQVFVKNGDNWDFVEAKGADIFNNSNAYVLTSSILDATKEYIVLLTSASSSGSDAYEIRFASGVIDVTKATLTGIKVNGEAVDDFAADKMSYDVELPFGTTDAPEVTATTGNKATVAITQATSPEGTATIVCTSQDGTSEQKTYTVNFSIKASANNDATLSDIKVNGTSVAGFAADTYEYTIGNFGINEIITVDGELSDANASFEIEKDEANGKILIKVTAEDTTTKLTYTLNFTRDAATPLASISDDTTWDFTKTGSSSVQFTDDTPIKKGVSEFNFADVLPSPDASFNAAALMGIGEYAVRDNKYFQGSLLKFNTTVAGKLAVIYCNTGNRSSDEDKRILTVNGVKIGEGSQRSDANVTEENISIAVGEVALSSVLKKDETVQYIRIMKVTFTKDDGGATAIDNTEDAVKANKVMRNGVLLIEKNGVLYNAQGAIVR